MSGATRTRRALGAATLPIEIVRELVLRNTPDGVFASDLDNRITYWAGSAERLFGFTQLTRPRLGR